WTSTSRWKPVAASRRPRCSGRSLRSTRLITASRSTSRKCRSIRRRCASPRSSATAVRRRSSSSGRARSATARSSRSSMRPSAPASRRSVSSPRECAAKPPAATDRVSGHITPHAGRGSPDRTAPVLSLGGVRCAPGPTIGAHTAAPARRPPVTAAVGLHLPMLSRRSAAGRRPGGLGTLVYLGLACRRGDTWFPPRSPTAGRGSGRPGGKPHGQGRDMDIVDLTPDRPDRLEQAARMLHDALPQGWPTLEAARAEVCEVCAVGPERLARAAIDRTGAVVGWIGPIRRYSLAWELHPLVVRQDRQPRGIGTSLVRDLERLLAARGCLTLFVGSDDETGETSVGGMELYPDVLGHAARLTVHGSHPVDFYRRIGFAIVGLFPDANGPGRP